MKKILLILLTIGMILLPNINVFASNKTLYDIISSQAKSDNGKLTSDPGLYTISTTLKDNYPIHYYRGDVDNNSVLFANQCWRIVRTTETGGVKLIYDGKPDENNACGVSRFKETEDEYRYQNDNFYNYYDESLSVQYSDSGYMHGDILETSNNFDLDWLSMSEGKWYDFFNIKEDYDYNLDKQYSYYFSDSVSYENGQYVLDNPVKYKLEDNRNNIIGKYTCWNQEDESCPYSSIIYITYSYNSAYNIGIRYLTLSNGQTKEKIINEKRITFGEDVKYENGIYTLINTETISFSELLSSNHEELLLSKPYTFLNSNDKSTVHYIYDASYLTSCYVSFDEYCNCYSGNMINFRNGSKNLDNEIKEKHANKVDSNAKQIVDNWYKTNLINYADYFEDAIWCNDRTETNYIYDVEKRIDNNEPSLKCSRKDDAFTVDKKNGNGMLTYPVGLITADEAMYAGIYDGYDDDLQSSSYLPRNTLMMSPAGEVFMDESYYIEDYYYTFESGTGGCEASEEYKCFNPYALPSVSLKANIGILSGDGSDEDPYQLTILQSSNVTVPNTLDNISEYIIIFAASLIILSLGFFIRKIEL